MTFGYKTVADENLLKCQFFMQKVKKYSFKLFDFIQLSLKTLHKPNIYSLANVLGFGLIM